MRCPSCGKEIIEPSRFCSDCGARLSSPAPLTQNQPSQISPKISGLAIASLVMGIIILQGLVFGRALLYLWFGLTGMSQGSWLTMLGSVFFGFFGIVDLILGIFALVQINQSQGRIKGIGMAIIGIVLGGLILILSVYAFSLCIIRLLKFII